MSQITTHISMVRQLFSDSPDVVTRLAMQNENFRALCEDYGLAVEALHRLEETNRPEDVEKMIEYRTIIKELQDDLRQEFAAAAKSYPKAGPS